MDRVVQQNASLVAESAADAQHMSDQAGELMELVARFRIAAQAAAPDERAKATSSVSSPAPTALPRGEYRPALAHNPIPSDRP